MTNILTAMGQAYGDSIPMLVISSVNRVEQLGMGGGRLHELPSQRSLTSNVTAFSHTLMRPDELPAVLTRAFAIFGSARPRPVHIEIPIDVITAPADHVDRKLGAIPEPAGALPRRGLAAPSRCCRRPGGPWYSWAAARAAPPSKLGSWSRRSTPRRPAPSTPRASCPRAIRCRWDRMHRSRPVRELVLASDAVLAIGTEMGETDYDLVFDGNLRIKCPLVRIDIDPEQVNSNFPADVAIVSDPKLAIESLLMRIDGRENASPRQPGREAHRRSACAPRRGVAGRLAGSAAHPGGASGRPARPDRRRRLDAAGVLRQPSVRTEQRRAPGSTRRPATEPWATDCRRRWARSWPHPAARWWR